MGIHRTNARPTPHPLASRRLITKKMNSRLHQIDQLRGLAACGIMLFHFVSFQFGELPAESILGRIGLYGVSLFYVISGIALGHVYGPLTLAKAFPMRSFLVKRFFRLMPLFILATLIALILSKKDFSTLQIALNISGLFAFFDYDGGIATGSWSIGNEWVFYLLLPAVLLILTKKNLVLESVLWVFAVVCISTFAFHEKNVLAEFWASYIHPFNHLLFFFAGSAMGFYQLHTKSINWKIPILGVLALIVFCFLPVHGDRVGLVSSWPRLVLSASTILFALAWYRINIRFWQPIETGLIKIGDWSYGIYMLHPLIWSIIIGGLKWMHWQWPPSLIIVFASAASLLASAMVFKRFEVPLMQWCLQKFLTRPLAP
jgi:exopolysaccharide production protein ExoZ